MARYDFTVVEVKQARTEQELNEVRRLFREYEEFLGVDLCFQHFEEEMAGLPGKYASPDGGILIGLDGVNVIGCVAVRRFSEDICEMKRLYVTPEARGTGLGRRLGMEIVNLARGIGYSRMRLDTLERLTEAMRLYESLGFQKIPPYYHNPLPGVIFWEMDLREAL